MGFGVVQLAGLGSAYYDEALDMGNRSVNDAGWCPAFSSIGLEFGSDKSWGTRGGASVLVVARSRNAGDGLGILPRVRSVGTIILGHTQLDRGVPAK